MIAAGAANRGLAAWALFDAVIASPARPTDAARVGSLESVP
jgi:hypothetical protein